ECGGGMCETEVTGTPAGERMGGGRWTAARRAGIRRSRIEAPRALVDAAAAATPRPKVLVNASAIGYYGERGDEPLDETAAPGAGFLARVCIDWEAEARRAQALDLRGVLLRIGIVLAPDGGAVSAMLLPFRARLGGPVGRGGGRGPAVDGLGAPRRRRRPAARGGGERKVRRAGERDRAESRHQSRLHARTRTLAASAGRAAGAGDRAPAVDGRDGDDAAERPARAAACGRGARGWLGGAPGAGPR